MQYEVILLLRAIRANGAWELRLLSTRVAQMFVEVASVDKSVATTVARESTVAFRVVPRQVRRHWWDPICNRGLLC